MKRWQIAGILMIVAMLMGMGLKVANAAVIDFDSIASEISVTTIGDATFSLAGDGESGDPSTSDGNGDGSLWNSIDGYNCPTNTILKVEFDTSVSGVLFDFNNWGNKATSWTLFDTGNSVIASGSINTASGSNTHDVSAYAGVKSIEFNNNGNNWYFALNKLTYEAAAVPEPTSLVLWSGLGVMGLIAARRRRRAA